MNVTYFFRKPTTSFFSIEQLFNTVVSSLKIAEPKIVYLPFKSTKPLALLQNCLHALKNQGHINHITGDVYYIVLALKGNRTILTIHDLESLHSPNKYKNLLLQLLWFKWPVRKAKYITVISEHSKQQLLSATKISADKVFVIPNCVSFTPKDYKPKPTLNKTEPVLLQIGTKTNKNLENLIIAIKGLACKLLIIGNLSEKQTSLLSSAGIKYENYKQLAYDKVISLYYQADIITFVSTFEGFGLPILEANALGRPIVTSNITAMPEVAGEGALLVDPYNPNSIREAINKLISNDSFRNELVEAGYRNVQRFKPDKVAAQYEDLYKKVIAEAT